MKKILFYLFLALLVYLTIVNLPEITTKLTIWYNTYIDGLEPPLPGE